MHTTLHVANHNNFACTLSSHFVDLLQDAGWQKCSLEILNSRLDKVSTPIHDDDTIIGIWNI